MSEKTLIIARHDEDMGWLAGLTDCKIRIMQKGMPNLPNEGRESLSYLRFIVDNYYDLDGTYYFVQGNPIPHFTDLINFINKDTAEETMMFGDGQFICGYDGSPQHDLHPHLHIKETADEIGLELPPFICFVRSAQFKITGISIRRIRRSVYQALINLHDKYDTMPWVMERLWGILLDQKSSLLQAFRGQEQLG